MQNTFQSKSLYYQLVEILKQRIENSMVAHDKLPSERELTSFYGVSRTTVRLALQELEKWATFIDSMEKEPLFRN